MINFNKFSYNISSFFNNITGFSSKISAIDKKIVGMAVIIFCLLSLLIYRRSKILKSIERDTHKEDRISDNRNSLEKGTHKKERIGDSRNSLNKVKKDLKEIRKTKDKDKIISSYIEVAKSYFSKQELDQKFLDAIVEKIQNSSLDDNSLTINTLKGHDHSAIKQEDEILTKVEEFCKMHNIIFIIN